MTEPKVLSEEEFEELRKTCFLQLTEKDVSIRVETLNSLFATIKHRGDVLLEQTKFNTKVIKENEALREEKNQYYEAVTTATRALECEQHNKAVLERQNKELREENKRQQVSLDSYENSNDMYAQQNIELKQKVEELEADRDKWKRIAQFV